MGIVLARVDCRLIHGQIIEAWIPFTGADCLVVANDEAAEDKMERTIMQMAVPPTVEVAILSVREAAQNLSDGPWADKRVLLLFANITDALAFCRGGLSFDSLNLGNLYGAPGTTQVTYSVSLGTDDLDRLKEISACGVRIEARSVPQDPPKTFNDIVSSRIGG